MTPRFTPGLVLAALCLSASVGLHAAPAASTSAAAKKATPTKAKPKTASKAATKVKAKKTPAKTSRVALTAATATGAGLVRTSAAGEAALGEAELLIADRVYTGTQACELGASVSVTRDPRMPGYFDVQIRNLKYRMMPVATTTGAIRLEDPKSGTVWLQILNKSMLMNQKLGQRLADECRGTEQQAINEGLKHNPPPSVFDPRP